MKRDITEKRISKANDKGLLPVRRLAAFLCALFVLISVSLGGCAPSGESVEDIIDRFMDSDLGHKIIHLIDGDTWQEEEGNTIIIGDGKDSEEQAEDSKDEAENSEEQADEKDTGDDATPVPVTASISSDIITDDLTGLSDEQIKYATDGMARYCYAFLDDEDRALYRDIYAILLSHGRDVKMNVLDSDKVDRVFQLVLNDHPEIFYVTGYELNKYSIGNKTTSLEFTGTYDKSETEAEEFEPLIDKYVSRCLLNAPSGSDYDKAKYVYDYIVDHTQYNLTSKDNQNILSVFCYGQSVCQGYAKATQYLLNELGVPCLLVTGTTSTGESHAWNMACLDGSWCYIDTTWGDASYKTNAAQAEPGINYDFFGADDALMRTTHMASSLVELPVSGSLKNYYYSREGLYFTDFEEADKQRLKELFDSYYEAGRDRLVVKCSDKYVYDDMLYYLVDQQNIFNLQKAKEGKVSYARIVESHAIIFYL